MMKIIFPSLGLIGSIIIISAYWPQIVKLIKLKKSDEFSILAWLIWLSGNILLLIYAITTRDFVYITLETISVLSLLLICVLIIIYREENDK